MPRMRPPSCARSGCESANASPSSVSATSSASSAAASAALIASRKRSTSPSPATCSKRPCGPVRSAARPQSAPTPSTAVCTTISSTASRSSPFANDWPTRRIASRRRLRSSWSSSSRFSSSRAIRLNSMPSAANSSLPSVGTAIRKSPAAIRRAASSRRWIWACSERETVRANAKAAISAAARIAMTSSAESLRPPSSRCGEQAHLHAAGGEAGTVEAGDAQRAAADLDLAALGQALGAGVGERRDDQVVAGADDDVGARHALDERARTAGR